MIATDWATVDYYATLGVATDATEEEIGRAFRALAKQLHPDRFGDDSIEAERFKLVTRAYEVLSNPEQRRDYDGVDRTEMTLNGVRRRPPNPMGSVPKPPARPMVRWTPAKALATTVAGFAFCLAGIAMTIFMIGLHAAEGNETRGRQQVTALIAARPDGTKVLMFTAPDGTGMVVAPPERATPGVLRAGRTLPIWFRTDDPTDVIADESYFARDFTLWFVTVKFLFGGPVVAAVGIRQRRRCAANSQ